MLLCRYFCVIYVQQASKHHPYRRASKHMGISKHTGVHPNMWGCPNIWGHLNIQEGIQTYGGIQIYGGIWTPLNLTKHIFFVLCMYRGHPNIKTYRGIQTYVGVSKHTAGIPACLPILRSGFATSLYLI